MFEFTNDKASLSARKSVCNPFRTHTPGEFIAFSAKQELALDQTPMYPPEFDSNQLYVPQLQPKDDLFLDPKIAANHKRRATLDLNTLLVKRGLALTQP